MLIKTKKHSKKEIERYYINVLNCEYGTILEKHIELAKKIRKKKIKTFIQVREYIEEVSEYDNWSLRDIDKALALICIPTLKGRY